jgi:hypothetical protein
MKPRKFPRVTIPCPFCRATVRIKHDLGLFQRCESCSREITEANFIRVVALPPVTPPK